jgi:pyridoxal phosphate enzyme (YggS family)
MVTQCATRYQAGSSFFLIAMSIPENVASVRSRIEAACRRAGRNPEEVGLMAVTKTVPAERIHDAYAAGMRIFGENRVQDFASKRRDLVGLERAEWHMIGHLQSNKVNRAAELFATVDSLDSLRLAMKLNARAAELGKMLPVLVEINLGGEEAKSGIAPDANELQALLSRAPELAWLKFSGLMAVPPYTDDPARTRPYFRALRELFYAIARRELPSVHMEVLSMGMSHDFEVAIEEGSNLVRVGTAIFGERPRVRKETA